MDQQIVLSGFLFEPFLFGQGAAYIHGTVTETDGIVSIELAETIEASPQLVGAKLVNH
jgi:hypothetical protein